MSVQHGDGADHMSGVAKAELIRKYVEQVETLEVHFMKMQQSLLQQKAHLLGQYYKEFQSGMHQLELYPNPSHNHPHIKPLIIKSQQDTKPPAQQANNTSLPAASNISSSSSSLSLPPDAITHTNNTSHALPPVPSVPPEVMQNLTHLIPPHLLQQQQQHRLPMVRAQHPISLPNHSTHSHMHAAGSLSLSTPFATPTPHATLLRPPGALNARGGNNCASAHNVIKIECDEELLTPGTPKQQLDSKGKGIIINNHITHNINNNHHNINYEQGMSSMEGAEEYENFRFKCRECSFETKWKQNLTRHCRIHTGEKNFSCEICDKKFNQKSNLKVHIRTHTGEKPYQCPICLKRFAASSNLKTHTKKNHGNLNMEECAYAALSYTPKMDGEYTL